MASAGVFTGIVALSKPEKLLSDEGVTLSLLTASGINAVNLEGAATETETEDMLLLLP
jgi:hypothetical protein